MHPYLLVAVSAAMTLSACGRDSDMVRDLEGDPLVKEIRPIEYVDTMRANERGEKPLKPGYENAVGYNNRVRESVLRCYTRGGPTVKVLRHGHTAEGDPVSSYMVVDKGTGTLIVDFLKHNWAGRRIVCVYRFHKIQMGTRDVDGKFVATRIEDVGERRAILQYEYLPPDVGTDYF
ncbi:MAG: hypothetical protein HYX75_02665 [Acidobacteria bacterium]|nr:hypothetical protein [Acidobacteriota bacterium]